MVVVGVVQFACTSMQYACDGWHRHLIRSHLTHSLVRIKYSIIVFHIFFLHPLEAIPPSFPRSLSPPFLASIQTHSFAKLVEFFVRCLGLSAFWTLFSQPFKLADSLRSSKWKSICWNGVKKFAFVQKFQPRKISNAHEIATNERPKDGEAAQRTCETQRKRISAV